MGPGHFLCRMNISNVFVRTFFCRFLNIPTAFVLTTLLFQFFPCLSSPMTPQSYCQYLKICAVKKLSCNPFLVDVTLAVCDLSQKSCSNVNISASAVHKRVSCESKNANDLSGAAFWRDVFSFFKFLSPQATSWITQKHSCNVHCLKSYPGMLTLLVCHTNTDPMQISLVFKKIILSSFGQGYR